jgi:hypothetical protein
MRPKFGAIGAAARPRKVRLCVQRLQRRLDTLPIGRVDRDRHIHVLRETGVPVELQGGAADQHEAHLVTDKRFKQCRVARLQHTHAAVSLCSGACGDQ